VSIEAISCPVNLAPFAGRGRSPPRLLAAGRTADEVLADYPYLERADILAALEFAADAVQEHELPLAQPA
jgi:Protein of unknown function (DUF433)